VRLLVERAGGGVMWRCRSFRSWISARSAESRLRHRVEAGRGHLTLTPISHFPLFQSLPHILRILHLNLFQYQFGIAIFR
jgi:hypothetical protein